MDELTLDKNWSGRGPAGNGGRFVAQSGSMLVLETRDIAKVRCENGLKVGVATRIISSLQSARGSTSYVVRFTRHDENGSEQIGAAMNFDEIDEFIGALDYVHDLASRILHEQRDYTEVRYSTKDNVVFGFYQMEDQQQQAFIDVGATGNSVFLVVEKLPSLRRVMETARQHLMDRGAGAQTMEV